MSRLLQLKSNKGARKKAKRVGRGNGSGHGTYSTRGMNGQNSRTGGGTRPGFEGGQTPIYRKMPKLKGFNNLNRVRFQVVNVDRLNTFEENEEIDVMRLFEKKLISNKDQPVKILGNGDLTKKLVVKADRISASAKEKIEKAKGSAIELMAKTEQPAV
ncbi:MAG TPA: 50S ribosomal protein L15 [Candidatus Gracilibacteria bacterium]|nr:50S ribosomal protein L15 [Candidatus Gracilibacteria bacterium]